MVVAAAAQAATHVASTNRQVAAIVTVAFGILLGLDLGALVFMVEDMPVWLGFTLGVVAVLVANFLAVSTRAAVAQCVEDATLQQLLEAPPAFWRAWCRVVRTRWLRLLATATTVMVLAFAATVPFLVATD